ncbi:TolC family protein [Parasediminibacterium paludis]|uniref:TolC family protein n=1 Tax=Parasediminibacterium paludis TaxID=908966 RepID=A0ABV8Q2L6_9BACT
MLVASLLFVGNLLSQYTKQTIYTLDTFIAQIKKYHPVAKQADIQVDKAAAELLSARGSFDPTIALDASRKTFDGKNYYYYTNPELGIPLPVGNIKTGLENNGGDYITSEVTKGKTSYLGVEMPLAKGLLLDKRRAVLQQAKLYRSQSEQERLTILNNLLFDAYTTYWQWAGSFQQYKLFSQFTEIASNRLRLVRIAYNNGDRAMMDTVEAFTQLQNYQLMQSDAMLRWNNAKLELSNFLWLNNDSSYFLPENYVPETLQFNATNAQQLEEVLTKSAEQNPLLKAYDFKLMSLDVERKLKFQSLLPYVSLKANILNKDYYALKNVSTDFIQNNYKWGIDFKIPIFLREARGDYKKAQLKIQETNLEYINKKQQTVTKIKSYYNDFTALSQQLAITQNMYRNYQALLKTEELKFAQGESSLFLINSRETKVIELLQKQIELYIKYNKAKYAVEWAAGLLR